MLLSAVFWGPTHYCVIPDVHHRNPLTLSTGIKGHIVAKWVPDNNGIDSPTNTVWISSVQCTDRNKTQNFTHLQCNTQSKKRRKDTVPLHLVENTLNT